MNTAGNSRIKPASIFMDIAISLGADYVATGHYCRVIEDNNNEDVIEGSVDENQQNKDE